MRLTASHPTDSGAPVAWWLPERTEPTPEEASARFAFFSEHGPSPYAFAPSAPSAPFVIRRVGLDDVDVQLLIAQLNADLFARYPEPGALVFSLTPADLVEGVGSLVMGTLDGRPVACGAFRMMDDVPGMAEIKRMYVAPSARGNKLGAAVLDTLERSAMALGVRRFVLETGPRQPEALQRFSRAGYATCMPWGAFIGKSFSICMEKRVG